MHIKVPNEFQPLTCEWSFKSSTCISVWCYHTPELYLSFENCFLADTKVSQRMGFLQDLPLIFDMNPVMGYT